MRRLVVSGMAFITALSLVLVGCAPAAPAPTATSAPAAPTKAAEPTKPAAAAPAPTKAAEPTKPAATSAPTAAPAKKVAYPEKGKVMTFVIPYAAGGATDIQGRLLAAAMEKDLGIQIQVVNKPGADGQVAYTEFVRAKPDGYDVLSLHLPSIAISYLDPSRKAVYTRKEFQPVAAHVWDPSGIAVKADSPYKGLKDLVDAMKDDAQKVSVGVIAGSGSHMGMIGLGKIAGVNVNFVQFDSNAPVVTALLGGHITAAVQSSASFLPMIKSGEARLLAITDRVESKFFPGVKTAMAQGYNTYNVTSRGWVVPTGTPKEIVDVLSRAMQKPIEGDAELLKKMDEAGLVQRYLGPAEYEASWVEEEARTEQLLKDLGRR